MKRTILSTFAVFAIAGSIATAQSLDMLENFYAGYWSPVEVIDAAVSTNIEGDWDDTFTLVYRVMASGNSYQWTPGYSDERADVCSGNAVEEATNATIRDYGYLILVFNMYSDPQSCSDALPWVWVCQDAPKGRVSLDRAYFILSGAAPFSSGVIELDMDGDDLCSEKYVLYAAVQESLYSLPEFDFDYTPVWTPNFSWNIIQGDCLPSPDPCWEIDWDYVQPETAILKFFAIQDFEENGESVVIDLISGPARQTSLNRIIGRNCCSSQIFYPQTFKGGLMSLGSTGLPGAVTDWYNEWENCPENLIICLDLRIDLPMTQAHNVCDFTPDIPGGGCTPYRRGGFSLW